MKIGLVGNQNSGKTTLFNCLTGMNAKIGNWPGVTIEKKVGKIKQTEHEITDLPGIYSLSPYTTEEEVSRRFIFEEKPDLIINIIDATSLERSLYLTTQLLELDCKVIIALNMADILAKNGTIIDIQKLSKELGTKVIQISALKEFGVDELIKSIDEYFVTHKKEIYDANIENAIVQIEYILKKYLLNKRFISIKMLEGDIGFKKYNIPKILAITKETEAKYDTNLEEVIATQRYLYIERTKKKSLIQKQKPKTTSDKLDKVFLNKWLALPIFVVIMFFIYYLSVGVVGKLTVNGISNIINLFGDTIQNILIKIKVSEWINSLIVNGIIAGVGSVLNFIPQLIILFLCISILETTGYMSRIALLLDRIFRKIGLSGKSLVPFIIGSGCSVPGIMGSRIIENEDERRMTAILTPFIPCSAKLPIIALFTGYFFPKHSGLASAVIYFLAIAIIILSAIVMKKFIFKNTSSTYISELPEYKKPSIKYIVKDVNDKVVAFIKRAGTVILLCSIIIWFLLSFSCKMQYGVSIDKSILASAGRKISCIFYPILGVNSWEAAVSAIQGLVAKEQVISSMTVIGGFAENSANINQIFSSGGIFGFFSAASAYAFMIFNLFSAPCFGAIGAMRKELGSIRRTLKAVIFQIVLAWCLATIVYQVGSRLESGVWNIANITIVAIIIIISFIILMSMINNKNKECIRCPYCKECTKS